MQNLKEAYICWIKKGRI